MDSTTTRRDRWLVITAICLFVLMAIGLGSTAVTVIQYSNLAGRSESAARCQSKINSDFLTALGQRSEASDLDRQAIRQIAQSGRDMIIVLLRPDATQEEKVKAVSDWQKAQIDADKKLGDADATRLQNPLPILTSCQ